MAFLNYNSFTILIFQYYYKSYQLDVCHVAKKKTMRMKGTKFLYMPKFGEHAKLVTADAEDSPIFI